MKQKQNFLPFFLVFFGLSLVLILLGSTGIFGNITSFANKVSNPGKDAVYVFTLRGFQNKAINSLTQENQNLKKKLSEEKNILNENIALKSQFEETGSGSKDLLPAKVIGFPGFVPGISLPDYLIIDKGLRSGVVKGNAVVSNNYLVGRVVLTYPDFSKIELITNKNSTFTAKIEREEELNGVVKGQGDDKVILDNVLLTQELKKDEAVLTKGDLDERGNGYPPDILVGEIEAIEKNQSDLFQRASVVSPIDFKNLNIVFVLK